MYGACCPSSSWVECMLVSELGRQRGDGGECQAQCSLPLYHSSLFLMQKEAGEAVISAVTSELGARVHRQYLLEVYSMHKCL